jgi:16S rRNA (guanine527-N7)-methyltransferase
LRAALERARELGYLGERPVEAQIAHSLGFARVVEEQLGGQPPQFLDLGSGGGVPGLILAERWPTAGAVLLDANQRRARFLTEQLRSLGWEERVTVACVRAEEAGRDPRYRGSQPVVTARSFGLPAVVAECGAPLLRVGGILVVSEPPLDPARDLHADRADVGHLDRWPAEALAELGLRPAAFESAQFSYQVLRQQAPCPPRYPRRTGVPEKRPLYR